MTLEHYVQQWCLLALVKPLVCYVLHFSVFYFHNAAIGIPPPNIIWTYNATLGGMQVLTSMNSNATSKPLGIDSSGRHIVKSTLSLLISPTDGGMVTCIAGTSQSQPALLTVLGRLLCHCMCFLPSSEI